MRYLMGDWGTTYASAEALEKDLGVQLTREGGRRDGEVKSQWIESWSGDTLLLVVTQRAPGCVSDYVVRVWNGDNVRYELAQLLGLPVYRNSDLDDAVKRTKN